MIAIFDTLSFGELIFGAALAVMLFGKNLPQAAAKAAIQIQKLRRQMGDLRKEIGLDEHLREADRAVREAMREAEREVDKERIASSLYEVRDAVEEAGRLPPSAEERPAAIQPETETKIATAPDEHVEPSSASAP